MTLAARASAGVGRGATSGCSCWVLGAFERVADVDTAAEGAADRVIATG